MYTGGWVVIHICNGCGTVGYEDDFMFCNPCWVCGCHEKKKTTGKWIDQRTIFDQLFMKTRGYWEIKTNE